MSEPPRDISEINYINEIMAADRANTKRLRAELEARQMAEEPGKVNGEWASEAPRAKVSGPDTPERTEALSVKAVVHDEPVWEGKIAREQDAGLDTPRQTVADPTWVEDHQKAGIIGVPEEGPDPYDLIQALKASRDSWEFVTDDLRSAYLAGPMRGYKDFNYPLFNAVAKYLRHCGLVIENPAESDAEVHERAIASKHALSVYMERDLADVARTDAVLVLPGWEKSEGARIETTVAWMLGHPVYELPSFRLIEPAFEQVPRPSPDWTGDEPLSQCIDAPLTPLPTDATARKGIPVVTGVLDYFPAALAEVAKVSKAGNDQHNPGEPLHWARGKSMDQADTLVRHLMERGTVDVDGMRHSAKAAWRALAILQLELEEAGEAPLARGAS